MDEMESLSHAKWECQYHGVCIPKCRRKTLYGELRRHLGGLLRKLAEQRRVGSKKGACARSGRETFVGQHFWAAGDWVSTVDRDEEVIRTTSGTRSERISGWAK